MSVRLNAGKKPEITTWATVKETAKTVGKISAIAGGSALAVATVAGLIASHIGIILLVVALVAGVVFKSLENAKAKLEKKAEIELLEKRVKKLSKENETLNTDKTTSEEAVTNLKNKWLPSWIW